MITTISPSDLEKNTGKILDSVVLKKHIAVIERDGRAVAKIVPIIEDTTKEFYGSLPDFPDVKSLRTFKRDTTI